MSNSSSEDGVEVTLDVALKALANPVRRQVVTALLQTPGNQVSSCAAFNVTVSRSTLTQHLRVLHESGIVETIDHGNRVFVALRSAEIEQRLPGLLDVLRHAG
ncbi:MULTISPECIES: helix-turn-helix transcriptional regulator [Rhodococcus]|jgi:DNA-binding transcriptional ArsR family regulator|uniref:ArsR family transcriptional regulator n=1 Tax=Rhodococcus opacus TaxID=37919 RepID=A0A2S8I9L6_RHOOP|nr:MULTISPECIES: helix-turn-helix transcriptional regulator [Rhodococcus]MDI9979945.1 helix-turn-helix transcriptional regulator [Rhodococcus sp. IEGM 1307]PQP11457.1 ArsR family transcriptional regulator [Rhodococcus opacus]